MSKLSVVGIGPGDFESITIRADRVLRECEVIVGYPLYVELVRERYPDKVYRTTPMRKEAERCRMALESARSGKKTALVCSGDSGVYGMAALVYELRGEDESPEVEIVPGLTAACSGGALLGAPLTQDFAVVSLSDCLTPWATIEKRLEYAARADLSLVLYNPESKSRAGYLRRACEVLLRTLPGDRLCGLCRNIGREGESVELLRLEELASYPADMFCTVFIGNATTRKVGGKMITSRGYRNV